MKTGLKDQLKFLEENPRHKALFLLLLRSEGFMTSEILASKLEVSSRTIKSDIRAIAQKFDASQIQIISQRSKGMKIEIADEILRKEIIRNYQIFQSETIDNDFERNVQYILRRLLSTQKPVKVETLQDELYMNTSNYPNKEMQAVKEMLKCYKLRLTTYAKQGYKITGNKFYKSLLLVKMYRYFDQYTEPEFRDKNYEALITPKFASKAEIRACICQNILKTRIVFSDIYMERFLLFFILLCNMHICEEDVPAFKDDVRFHYEQTDEYHLICMIDEDMRQSFSNYPEGNESFLRLLTYMAIMSTDLYRFKDCNVKKYDTLIALAEDMRSFILHRFEDYFQVSAFDDVTTLKDLIKVLIPIAMKIFLQVNDDVDLGYYSLHAKSNKVVIVTFIDEMTDWIKERYAYQLSEREKNILLNVIYEYINNIHLEYRKVRIALIAIDGRINTQQLKFAMKNHFQSYIEKIDTKVIYELDQIDTKQYDYFFCMEYGKNMNIPYQPIFFFKEGMSDMYFYNRLQNIFLNSFYYDRLLPKISYHIINSIYKLSRFPKERILNKNASYVKIDVGTRKEIAIYINFKEENEKIHIYHYDNEGMDTDGKQFYIVLESDVDYNKQKFKMILEFINRITEDPSRFKANGYSQNVDIKSYFNRT